MEARPGDRLHLPSEQVGEAERTGVIVEILGEAEDHPFYKVRWEDDHETIVSPSPEARVEVKH